MKRRIIAMLLVLVMAVSMATAVSAAGTDGEAALGLASTRANGELVITVTLQGCGGVTNGRFCVNYDAQVLTLVGAEVSDAYAMSSVNDETAGAVWLAWIGSDLTDDETLMLTLRFTAPAETVTVTAEADGVYADTEAVDVAGASLTVAYTGVDTSALEEAVKKAEGLDGSAYTEESWAAVEEALEAGKAVLADPDATQEEVDAAAKALNDAMAALVPAVDTSALEEAIEKAEGLDEDRYTDKSWAAVEKALKEAKSVLADPDATQEEVDAAAKALNDAMAALKLASGTDTDTGDHDLLAVPVVLAVVSLMGLAALSLMEKRRNRA